MKSLGTWWFMLSGRELRVLLVAAAVALAALTGVEALRRMLWSGGFRVENARESLANPARLDLNTATDYQLRLLPGIGEKTAQAIIASRKKKPFQRLEDLTRVPGIGPKTVERVRPHLMCAPPDEQSGTSTAPRGEAGR